MSGVGRGGGRVAGGGDGVVDWELEGLDLLDEGLTREGIFLNRSSILPRENYSGIAPRFEKKLVKLWSRVTIAMKSSRAKLDWLLLISYRQPIET